MTAHKLMSEMVEVKPLVEQAENTPAEKQTYRSPQLRQVGTLADMQGCVCGTSCDCGGQYYNR